MIKETVYIGATFDVDREVPGVPSSDPVTKAWLTIKNSEFDADPGVIQKVITVSATSSGQIIQDGSPSSGNGTARLLFLLSVTDTATLGAKSYIYDIQVKLASKIIPIEKDIWPAGVARVTAAQS